MTRNAVDQIVAYRDYDEYGDIVEDANAVCAEVTIRIPQKKEKSADEKLKKEKLDKMKTTESYCAIKGCH